MRLNVPNIIIPRKDALWRPRLFRHPVSRRCRPPMRWPAGVRPLNAGNYVQVGSSGRVKISPSGKVIIAGPGDPCCCASTTYQLYYCSSGAASPFYITAAQLAIVGSYTVLGLYGSCFTLGDNVSATTEVFASGVIGLASCSDPSCPTACGTYPCGGVAWNYAYGGTASWSFHGTWTENETYIYTDTEIITGPPVTFDVTYVAAVLTANSEYCNPGWSGPGLKTFKANSVVDTGQSGVFTGSIGGLGADVNCYCPGGGPLGAGDPNCWYWNVQVQMPPITGITGGGPVSGWNAGPPFINLFGNPQEYPFSELISLSGEVGASTEATFIASIPLG